MTYLNVIACVGVVSVSNTDMCQTLDNFWSEVSVL